MPSVRAVAMLDEDGMTDQQVDDALLASRVDQKAKKPSVEAVFHAWAVRCPASSSSAQPRDDRQPDPVLATRTGTCRTPDVPRRNRLLRSRVGVHPAHRSRLETGTGHPPRDRSFRPRNTSTSRGLS